MSENYSESDSQSDYSDEWLTEPFPVMDLPQDLVLMILQTLDCQTLAHLCRANKHFQTLASPLLWRCIDFVALKEEYILDCEPLMAAQAAFFFTCSSLMDSDPWRWNKLARQVEVLRLVKMPGIGIPSSEPDDDDMEWVFESWAGSVDRTVFDVMTSFENLQELHFYIKEAYGFDDWKDEMTQRLGGKLTKLRRLDVGGNIPRPVIHAILSCPEKLEELNLIAMQDGQAGQQCHSTGLLFLSDMHRDFPSLKKLHPCKHAELGEDRATQGLPWDWPRDNDLDVLRDWVEFLTKVSPTLVELTLEDLYLDAIPSEEDKVSINFDEENSDDEGSRWATLGAHSSRRFRDVILPALAELERPALKKLSFVGVHVGPQALERAGVLERLGEDVEISVSSGRKARHFYENTPILISPPNGSFHDSGWTDPSKAETRKVNRD